MIAKFVKTTSLLLVCAAAGQAAHCSAAHAGAENPKFLLSQIDRNAALQRNLPMPRVERSLSRFDSPDWLWSQTLVASNPQLDESFGAAIALDGDTMIISSLQANPLGTGASAGGAVHVYTRTTTGWTLAQTLVADDGVAGDRFGFAVALKGDTAMIGAPYASLGPNADGGGKVYVFRKLAGAWTQIQKVTMPQIGDEQAFGHFISLDPPNALISSPAGMLGDDPTTAPVYALRETNGNWAHSQILQANDYVVGDIFGWKTGLSGDHAVIGAPGVNDLGGAVYAYHFVNGSWIQTQKFSASLATGMQAFGFGLAISSSRIVVGAPFTDVGNTSSQGVGYIFDLEEGEWLQSQRLISAGEYEGARFGYTVAIDGETALVASPWTTHIDGESSYGHAQIYTNTENDGFITKTVITPKPDVYTLSFSAAISGGSVALGSPFTNDDIGIVEMYALDRIFNNSFD